WLLVERAGAASHAPYHGRDCAPVFVEVPARREARPLLFDQYDAGATSRLVSRGPGAALPAPGKRRHPAADRGEDFLRRSRGCPSPPGSGRSRWQARPLPGPCVAVEPSVGLGWCYELFPLRDRQIVA